tara:strand:+ start:272 stop:1042 length:771 start_codon:yes stop_codon:yes gene_type:complete
MNPETALRRIIREKILEVFKKPNHEQILREAIRKMLTEGDLSDIHPHRSTGINTLEDVLKKSIPTLRTDFKRLTTDKSQRDSFRAHIVKAVKDALMPELVKAEYGPEGSALMAAPEEEVPEEAPEAAPEEEVPLEDDEELEDDMAALEEADIQIDIEDKDKKISVEPDEEPSPEEEFGTGLEDMDETGRNMAYTSFRKISQYVLDAYDSLANPKDKEIFLDYLVTNLKLYFDKFEDELQSTVEEPTTSEYDKVKGT